LKYLSSKRKINQSRFSK